MAEETTWEGIGELEQLKYKIAGIFDKVQTGRESANGRRITIGEYFSNEPTELEQFAFYEVEWTYYVDDPSLDNPLCYWKRIPRTKEEVERVNALADEGYLSAMLTLAQAFGENGMSQESIGWFMHAADQGSPQAYVRLGEMLMSGEEVGRDPLKGVQCFQTAITMSGDSTALLHLGLCYLDGNGVETDVQKGLSLLERSARQGNSNARQVLGRVYRDGVLVEQDIEKAVRWFELSCSGYNVISYGGLVESLWELNDFERILHWTELYKQMGAPRAYAVYGTLYMYGAGVNEDRDLAASFFIKAADMEDPYAAYTLFSLLNETNKDASLKYLKKAVALRWPGAEYDYGVMNWDVDREKATEVIMDAVSQGYGPAHEFAVEHDLIPKE